VCKHSFAQTKQSETAKKKETETEKEGERKKRRERESESERERERERERDREKRRERKKKRERKTEKERERRKREKKEKEREREREKKTPRKWQKWNLVSGDRLCGQRHGLAMNWVDQPRTSADERDVVWAPLCRDCMRAVAGFSHFFIDLSFLREQSP